jgi:hypothetical protein
MNEWGGPCLVGLVWRSRGPAPVKNQNLNGGHKATAPYRTHAEHVRRTVLHPRRRRVMDMDDHHLQVHRAVIEQIFLSLGKSIVYVRRRAVKRSKDGGAPAAPCSTGLNATCVTRREGEPPTQAGGLGSRNRVSFASVAACSAVNFCCGLVHELTDPTAACCSV